MNNDDIFIFLRSVNSEKYSLKFLNFKDNLSSNDHRKTSHQDASNGGIFISLGSIESKIRILLYLKNHFFFFDFYLENIIKFIIKI